MSKALSILLLLLIPLAAHSQDPREFNHGACIVGYENGNDSTKYYLTWSSAFGNAWEHDIYNASIYFDASGNLITEAADQRYIGTGADEAQEPVNASINAANNYILSVWEDGDGNDAPNVKAQLHHPDGSIIRSNWTVAGGAGSQHSAVTAHLGNRYLIFYADEAPPASAGAVLKAKVIDDLSGNQTQALSFTPNNEDHWWPVTVSNTSNTRSLIIWGNDGYAAMGTVLQNNTGTIQQAAAPQDYLSNTQQYFYQVTWLENISRFLLIARNGAYNNITDSSQICLIDTLGNRSQPTTVYGGILREAKMAVKWNACAQEYHVFYPSETNDLTHISIDNTTAISAFSSQISGHPDLSGVQWPSTGIWAMYVTDVDSSALFGDKYIALFVMNDVLSNNSVKVAVRLDTSLFCSPVLGLGVEKEKVRLYPNPTSGKVILPEGFENASYEIALINGKLLIRGNTVFGNIDLSKLIPGIYFIKATQKQSGKQYWFRVQKEN